MTDNHSSHRLSQITLPNFQCKLLVYGDLMLDQYMQGHVNRISPEAPIQVVQVQTTQNRAGGAANVALNLGALGASCHLFGITGQDEAGRTLTQILKDNAITPHFLQSKQHTTIKKLRVLGSGQQLIRLDFEQNLQDVEQSSLLKEFSNQLKDSACVILSDYAKGTLANIADIIALARKAGIPCLVDPKGHDFDRYAGATILTPNFKEFERVVGPCHSEQDILSKSQRLIEHLNLDALLITRSAHGMNLIQKSPETKQVINTHIPTRALEVYDVTGAGDTVISVMAACIGQGLDMISSARLANLAASIVIKKSGASQVSIMELQHALHKVISPNQIIMTQNQLKAAINEAKTDGQRIVMTNGCFDILHAGHVHYLEQARKLGDRLIVAINADAEVTAQKGPSRPINPLPKRMAVLASLRAVDYVVSFDTPSPQPLIADILPDVLVKGGDYQVHEIAGHKEVLANGGQVQILDFVDGCSTSNIINQIKAEDRHKKKNINETEILVENIK